MKINFDRYQLLRLQVAIEMHMKDMQILVNIIKQQGTSHEGLDYLIEEDNAILEIIKEALCHS